MEAMTATSFAVIDKDDEIEFVSPSSGTGVTTFKDFLEVADKQMSKALIGSTMVLDEGSSRSQGEVHMKNTNSFIVGYASMIENLINDDDSFQRNFWWEELSINLYADLHSELSATVETPTPTRAERRKILAQVARAKRERLPGWKEPARALLASAGAPAQEKEMADRRGLSRWAKRLTGSYCDAEVAAFLTAARRQCGYRNPRVSAAALKQDRRRNPRQYSLKP